MKLFADSGSTKCDWMLVDENYEQVNRLKTIGFNPYFLRSSLIENILRRDPQFVQIAPTVTEVFFYGAGCSSSYYQNIVHASLQVVFPNAEIKVDHDLTACAFACYDGKPSICAILGTGSNSCYFDGETLTNGHPSMGFIIGDEGSGNYFGKKLLKKYFYKQLPQDLHDAFEKKYKLSHLEMTRNVYEGDHSNVYLAGFMEFISEHRTHPFFKPMLRKGFKKFVVNHVKKFPQYGSVETHFVGSIAHYFKGILQEVCEKEGVILGRVVRKPVEGLVQFHKNYGYKAVNV